RRVQPPAVAAGSAHPATLTAFLNPFRVLLPLTGNAAHRTGQGLPCAQERNRAKAACRAWPCAMPGRPPLRRLIAGWWKRGAPSAMSWTTLGPPV
ncbi:MAG: hypothetical protein JXA67_20920, partial [Micromonosporaceae bacterium]|nr:hypothetical protein [Micromonosporaceae bacterium]